MITCNGVEIKPTMFPDGTSQVWKLPRLTPPYRIEWRWQSDAEFMTVAQLRDILKKGEVTLYMPYLPYARQDKPVSNEATFGLTTFAYLLNFLAFDKVQAFDPHSVEADRLICNFEPIYPTTEQWQRLVQPYDVICLPDAGAAIKYRRLLPVGTQTITADKRRDQATGMLMSHEIPQSATALLPGAKVLIVDDICDGGATFVSLAKLLQAAGSAQVDLYVSHGLFTKGRQALHDAGITNIFTKESLT